MGRSNMTHHVNGIAACLPVPCVCYGQERVCTVAPKGDDRHSSYLLFDEHRVEALSRGSTDLECTRALDLRVLEGLQLRDLKLPEGAQTAFIYQFSAGSPKRSVRRAGRARATGHASRPLEKERRAFSSEGFDIWSRVVRGTAPRPRPETRA